MADTEEKVSSGTNGELKVKVEQEEAVPKKESGEANLTPKMEEGGETDVKPKMEEGEAIKSEPAEAIKTEPSDEDEGEPTYKESKIIKQVEYYFGDINLARDKFLQEQLTLEDGWVPMETMLKFNRLKSISDDAKEICDALRKSKSGLMEVTEENTKLRRSKSRPLPENTTERKAELKKRSIYAKGFPLDVTLDMVEDFFKDYGVIENIQMRRTLKRDFKGSVFVIFEQEKDAEKFVKAEGVKYKDQDLSRCFKDDYFKRKDEQRQELKLKREKERQAANKGNKEGGEKKEVDEEEHIREKMTKGAILHLTGFEGDITIDDIRNFFTDFSTVRWVDFDTGDKEALVRFTEADKAGEVMEKIKTANDGKLVLNDLTLEGDVLEGSAEIEHWRKIFQAQADSMRNSGRNKNQRGRKRGPFGFKKGYQNRNKEDRSGGKEKSDGEPPAKAMKTE